MCTLALYFQLSKRTPLLIAANRDEFYDRPSLPPSLISTGPRIWGGRDLKSGGTWLGLNEGGMVVGILNRHTDRADPSRGSRGVLCLNLLKAQSIKQARELLLREDPSAYNPFNLICVQAEEALVSYHTSDRQGGIRVQSLSPGLHLLTNLDVDDPLCPKISASQKAFESSVPLLNEKSPHELADSMRTVLAHHDIALDDRAAGIPLCVHTPSFGTRSSAVLIAIMPLGKFSFFYCDEAPCAGVMKELSLDS
jgi:uncharacterized protein with NRDE domain